MSERQHRIESLLRELAASFVRAEANTDPLITINSVSLSPDFRNATVYFTTIPEEKEQHALIFLKRFGGELRRFIAKGSDLKIIPTLSFSIDSEERARQHAERHGGETA